MGGSDLNGQKLWKKLASLILGLSTAYTVPGPVLASEDLSVGSAGIDALRLHAAPYNLRGRKIAIGQVEIGRPGKFGLDKAVAQNRVVWPARVFFQDDEAQTNKHVDRHAQNVASIMISSDKAFPGVAPAARLYSAAVGRIRRSGQPQECLSTQHLAMQNSDDLRGINFSFGESLRQDPRTNAVLDGNALLTQCIDWSARVHNVLYVIAGNQGRGGISIPTDNYNGINVAFSRRERGQFAKIDFDNIGDPEVGIAKRIIGQETNIDNRRSIGLVSPGNQIPLVNLDGSISRASGTSFAAPHATATLALLQEYGDRQIAASGQTSVQWTLEARRHEVMKAVMLNSADKIKDRGDGFNLGMSRTLLDQNHYSWLASEAFYNQKIPLDIQVGSGHLNAYRAYQQFSPGQWGPEAPVPPVGWDYNTVEGNDSTFKDYILDRPLASGSMVSITLAWNRRVELEDANNNSEYDVGETFQDRGLNNLELYLMPAAENDIRKSIWSSVSPVDSVEHIFHRIRTAGRYKIRVQYRQQVNEPEQPYALAWWTVPSP